MNFKKMVIRVDDTGKVHVAIDCVEQPQLVQAMSNLFQLGKEEL